MNLHKMIEICLKDDNMHIFVMINALICINKYVITCINSMLSPSLDAAPHAPPDDLHLLITCRKGTHACTHHPISHFVSYDCLPPSFSAFALSVTFESIPQSHVEAAQVLAWKEEMDSKIEALVYHWTWTLVPCPIDANIVIC